MKEDNQQEPAPSSTTVPKNLIFAFLESN